MPREVLVELAGRSVEGVVEDNHLERDNLKSKL
jgi:hypothetical protein